MVTLKSSTYHACCGLLAASLAFTGCTLIEKLPTELPPSFTNQYGMEFVLISAGSFMMGCDGHNMTCRENEKPQHEVIISKPFYMSKYEVTQEQWKKVTGSFPHLMPQVTGGGMKGPYSSVEIDGIKIFDDSSVGWIITFRDIRQHPVNAISWESSKNFISILNQKENTDRYRLPTEAEWEYAARAGTTTTYSFGDDPEQLKDYAWCGYNDIKDPHPVGQKLPNAWGLYDMHGNVGEWVEDLYGNYYKVSVIDPVGPTKNSDSARVLRGGSWLGNSAQCTSTARKEFVDRIHGYHGYGSNIGFRIVFSTE